MFSPDAQAHRSVSGSSNTGAGTLRNPRRRQRHDTDSIKAQPVRKRSKLSDETFSAGNENGHLNGKVEDTRRTSGTMTLSLRKKKEERRAKEDGSVLLTKTQLYAVKQLPAVPEKLRSSRNGYGASTLPYSHHALAFTRDSALIWDYTSSITAPVPRAIPLPFASRASDPLPLGALVTAGPSSELGLVVVAPLTGKVTFWENVDSAESLSLFNKTRLNVDGSVGSMLSGETIIEVVDAEHAGFILRFSTGRIAHLTLRDSQGRPAISAQFLRNSAASTGGLFGHLKSFVPGGIAYKKDVTAVKARQSQQKGQMEVVAVTEGASFQIWEVDWAGRNEYKGEIVAKDELVGTIRNNVELQGDEAVRAVDFEILQQTSGHGNEVSILGASKPLEVLVLVAYTGPTTLRFSLVRLLLADGVAQFTGIYHLSSYGPPLDFDAVRNAKVLVPKPGHSAFAIFQNAIVIASLELPQDSPDNQLFSDTGRTVEPFQDVIYFKSDKIRNAVGFGLEEPHAKTKASSVIIFTQPANILRVIAEASLSQTTGRVSAKSKLEQAVYFASPTNVLDLLKPSETNFPVEELQSAALQISRDIVDANSEYLPTGTSSMEFQLARRTQALKDLISYLQRHYRNRMDRVTLWILLWHAERLAAAKAVWKVYDDRLKLQEEIRTIPLMFEIIDLMHDRQKIPANAQVGERDSAREFFLKDVGRIETIVSWAYLVLKDIYDDGSRSQMEVLRLTSEANDVIIAVFRTAFNFRMENVELYGLRQEDLKNGILVTSEDYRGLPEIWTSSHNVCRGTRQVANMGRNLALKHADPASELDKKSKEYVKKIATDHPELVKIICQTYMERYQYCLAQDDEKTRATGQNFKNEFEHKIRHDYITTLAKLDQTDKGMELAEELGDLHSLAHLVREDMQEAKVNKNSTDESTAAEGRARLKYLSAKIADYFKKFGDRWGESFFNNYVEHKQYASLFNDNTAEEQRFTNWIRGDPGKARLCWINDVLIEKNYKNAAKSLTDAATLQEPNAWAKGIQLSIAKLSLLAADEDAAAEAKATGKTATHKPLGQSVAPSMDDIKNEMKRLDIQKQLYKHIQPLVYGALDDASAVELAMDTYGKHAVAGRQALSALLKQGFEELLQHRALSVEVLIDILTLMDQVPSENPTEDICGREFWMALNVLDASSIDPKSREHEVLLKLIWKRVFVRNDWIALNSTSLRPDRDIDIDLLNTALGNTLLEGARHDAWDTTPSLTRLPPAEVQGAGSHASHLTRFGHMDDIRDAVLKDNILDDQVLSKALNSARLGQWWATAKRVVKETVEREASEAVAQGKRESEMELEVEEAGYGEGDYGEEIGAEEGESEGDGEEVYHEDVSVRGDVVESIERSEDETGEGEETEEEGMEVED